jgi:hypothetical protein
MAEQGSSARRIPEATAEPTMAQLLDPVAWERRLEEARARRAAALAARKGAGGEPATAPDSARQDRPDRPAPTGSPLTGRSAPQPIAAAGAGSSGLRAAGPSARPALAGIERAGPATGRAIDQRPGRSLRDLAAEARGTQPGPGPSAAASAPRARPLDPAPAARPIPLRGAGMLPPRREGGARPVEAGPVMEPADDLEPARPVPADPVADDGAAVDPGLARHPREPQQAAAPSGRDAEPAEPVLPRPALPSSARAPRITLPDPDPRDQAIDLDRYDFDTYAVAAASAPPRRGRMALVFGSGLVLGLVAALGLAVLLLDRLGGEAGGELEIAVPVIPATDTGDAAGSASGEAAALSEAAGSTAPDVTVTVAAGPGSPPEALAAPAPPAAEETAVAGAPDHAPLAAAAPESEPPAAPALSLPPPATLTPPGTLAAPADAPARPGLPSADASGEQAAPPAPAPLRDSGDPAPVAGDPLDPEALRAALAALPATTEPLETQPRPVARPAGLAVAAAAGQDGTEPDASGPEASGAAALAQGEAIPDETAAAAEAGAGGGLPSRIIVHAPSAVGEAEIDSVVAVLDGAGYTPTGRVSIPFAIGTTNVRYYFPEDAAAARAIADALGAAGQEAVARDFTGHRPRPTTGTVEIWLAGQPRSAPASSAPAVASSPPPPPAAAAPAPPPAPVRQADRPRQPPPQAQARGRPSGADAAMRELEALAEEIARAIERSLR